MRSQVKSAVWTKHIKAKDGKMVKTGVIVEKIMDAWNFIVNSSTKELYADFIIHFRKMCEKYPDLLKAQFWTRWRRKLFLHGPIKLDTLRIQQQTELSLPMLHWRIAWEIVRAVCVYIGTLWAKWSRTSIMRYKHHCVLILMKCNKYNFKYFNTFCCLLKKIHLSNKTHMFYFLFGSWEVPEMHLRNKNIEWYRRCIFETSTNACLVQIENVANIFFSSVTPWREFKINEYTHFADLQYEVHNLLSYGDLEKLWSSSTVHSQLTT